MDSQDKTVLGAIAAATGVSTTGGAITVMVTTTKILGITVATTTVALPVAGLVAAGGAVGLGDVRGRVDGVEREVEEERVGLVPIDEGRGLPGENAGQVALELNPLLAR